MATDVVRSGLTVQLVYVAYVLPDAFHPEMPNASGSVRRLREKCTADTA